MFTDIVKKLLRIRSDRRGASAIEYALIAAGAALAIGSMTELRTNLGSIFNSIRTAVQQGASSAGGGGGAGT